MGQHAHVLNSGDALDQWATWMRAAGRPESTIGLRCYHVARVLRDLRSGGNPWGVTTDDLIAYLGTQKWAAETRRAYRASLRSFYAWAMAAGHCTSSPAALLPTITPPRGVPRPIPEQVYRDALRNSDNRVRLMIGLAAMCGLRRGEIARVHSRDMARDLEGWTLFVHGKGGHVRQVPLPPWLGLALRRCGHGWIFPSPHGGHLTPHHVGKLVSAALPEGWTCHTLRHRCGTVAYSVTKDLRAVQELLGHARPETTAIYTKVPSASIRAAVDATSN